MSIKHYLRKKAFDPAPDVSYDEYMNDMLKKTLLESIQETSIDQKCYTLDTFAREYGN